MTGRHGQGVSIMRQRGGLRRALGLALCAVLASAAGLSAASAEDVESFYKSHKLTLGVPNGAGGGYDIYVRALSRHIAGHLPGNPTIVVQNVPAAGGMALANMIYSTVPKDGSYIGMVRGTVIQEQIYKNPQVQFDGRKFAWIGNMNSDYDTCIVWTASGVTSIDEFYTREIVVGASGVGAQSYSFPVVYRELLGMKLKVIAGYPGTPDRILAMERGELTGACGISTSSLSSALAPLLKDGKIRVIAQAGAHNDPRYPNVPNLLDQAKAPEVRQALEFLFVPLTLGRPFAGPPETPKDRLAALRQGMMDTLKDPAFLADAKKVGIDIEPGDYKETEALVEKLFATPPAVVARIQAAMPQ
jgi:tripartite-type tricarboxylate transporter receptor subunit TctC